MSLRIPNIFRIQSISQSVSQSVKIIIIITLINTPKKPCIHSFSPSICLSVRPSVRTYFNLSKLVSGGSYSVKS